MCHTTLLHGARLQKEVRRMSIQVGTDMAF